MEKNFDGWTRVKKRLHETKNGIFFHEREIWWCALGVNIGFEQDGHGETFERPAIILKKFNLDACLVIPLTAKVKEGTYYFPVGQVDGREATAVLSQIRFVDRRRFSNKIDVIDRKIFQSLVQKIMQTNFPKEG